MRPGVAGSVPDRAGTDRDRGSDGSYAGNIYPDPSVAVVWVRRLARVGYGLSAGLGLLAVVGFASAGAGPTNLQETQGLFWAMVAISIVGAVLTWGVMAYALWKFRDPKTKGRRYG